MFTYVYPGLLFHTYAYSCLTKFCHCLLAHVNLVLPMFTVVNLSLSLFTRVYLRVLVFTYVDHCLLGLLVFTYV